MIEVKNVTLQIKDKTILSDVDLTMEEGRIYGLVGNNGSGKTMLMKCICGVILPTKRIRCIRMGYGLFEGRRSYYRKSGIYQLLFRT